MLDKALMKVLGPVLNRLPRGWKTAAGLLALALVQILAAGQWIEPATADTLEAVAVGLFGIGVWHAKAKASDQA